MRTAICHYLELRGADCLIAVAHIYYRHFQALNDPLTPPDRRRPRTRQLKAGHGWIITLELRRMSPPDCVVENWPGSTTMIAACHKGIHDGNPPTN